MIKKDKYVIAVDMGGTNLKCAVVDKDYRIVKSTTRPAKAHLKSDKVINFIKIGESDIKWFEYGFIHQIKDNIFLYLNNGDLLGSINFKGSIRHVCYKDDNLLVETNRKAFLFKLKI